MSEYLQMWEGVKNLKSFEKEDWIKRLSPPTGEGVDFNGVFVNDVDLLEALKNSR